MSLGKDETRVCGYIYIYIYIYINEDHKNCLKAVQIKNKINRLEKNKIDTDSYKED